ncbi:MAG: S46 family peptidase [Bacteroidales bacterium]|nr:S46 family peptidase [Bacteroidales bacterium]
MRKRPFILLFILLLFSGSVFSGEGMWIPSLLHKFNMDDMHKKGFRLSAEEIYSINHSSLKDAIVIFGGGCTGELISDKGLLITNHHCGYGSIQKHSTMEHNYLEDGFWADNMEEELTNPGLTATFLVRIEDVTDRVVQHLNEEMAEQERQQVIDSVVTEIEKQATEGTHYRAVTKPFYYGNEFYMFIYETYRDVRLVGAPPSSVGKYGKDRDNWMWPRHTGDFSLFRIYAGKNNEPAEYDPANQPYNPGKHLPISLNGIDKGDFTMVMGYPGSTEQHLTSHAVSIIQKHRNPERIHLRDIRLEVMDKYMSESEAIELKYAAKQSGVSNSWKRWKGMIRGLKRLDAIEKKQKLEKEFTQWVRSSTKRQEEYGGLIQTFESVYDDYQPYVMARDYYIEAGYYGNELMRFVAGFNELIDARNPDNIPSLIDNLDATSFYKDYVPAIDREIAPRLFRAYRKNIDEKFHPRVFDRIDQQYQGDVKAYVEELYEESMFTDSSKVYAFLDEFKLSDTSRIKKDPAYRLAQSFSELYRNKIMPGYQKYNVQLDSLYRIYVRGLRTMKEDQVFWPDANFTMRVAYGEVKGYQPRDAVVYQYQTTLEGVMQKNRKGLEVYQLPDKLKTLYHEKDYGKYANSQGEMPVCFIASNHTSGGNSGSPVINANGELIGVNFDRNWEGTMSDIMYDPTQCRNITLDIRYALFIIDRFAEADWLIEEMTLVQ